MMAGYALMEDMRPLTIADSATIILGLQDEIRRSEESRYDHRLHGVRERRLLGENRTVAFFLAHERVRRSCFLACFGVGWRLYLLTLTFAWCERYCRNESEK